MIREFRRSLGRDSCAKLATYSERFFTFVRTHSALFPDSLRAKVLVDTALRAALIALDEARKSSSEGPDGERAVRIRIERMRDEWRQLSPAEQISPADVATALTAHSDAVSALLEEAGLADPAVRAALTELGIQAAMKDYENLLDATGIVIGGYGDEEFFPSFEQFECMGFLGTHFLLKREAGKAISRGVPAYMESFAIGRMIDTFRMGIGPETFESVVQATTRSLREFATKVRDAVAPGTEVPNLDLLVEETATNHRADWYGSSARTHYWPLTRVIGALPVSEMAVLAQTLIELESLKERVTQESESVGGPIDVAAISKHDGFVWIDRKHYFRTELNPRFIARQHLHDRS